MTAVEHGVHVPAAAPTAPRNNFTLFVDAGPHGPAPQPPAQTLVTLRAMPQVNIFQLRNQPGLHDIMNQPGIQLVSPSQAVVQKNAAPSTAAVASTALCTGAGASGTPTRPQLVPAHSPAQPRVTAQPTPNPYSVTATTTQSMQFQQSTASYNHHQQQLQFYRDLNETLAAFEHSSADFLLSSHLKQISERETAGMGPLLRSIANKSQ